MTGDPRPGYSGSVRKVETLAIVLFAGLATWCTWRLAHAATHAGMDAFGAIVTAIVLGWIATDFFSGLVHWAGDTWGSARTPLVGGWFVRPFRQHHEDARAMTQHDFVETNGSSAIAGSALLAAASLVPLGVFAQAFVLSLAIGGLMANQCHKWAHQKESERGWIVRVAQRCGLTLSPEAHRRHHSRPHDSFYCTASGWMNRPLEAIGFFRAIEGAVVALTRATPRS
jgi:hypothetical protein